MNKANIKTLIERGLTQREMARMADVSQSTIRYWLGVHGLTTVRTKKTGGRRKTGRWSERLENKCLYCSLPIANANKFCNMTCKANYDAVKFGREWEEAGQSVLSKRQRNAGSITGTARRYIFIRDGNACVECGWTHDFGNSSFPPLECAHIDGNYRNNSTSNIRLLCPNCHAIETRINPVSKGNGRWSTFGDSRNQTPV